VDTATSQLITKSSRFTSGLSTIPSRNPRRKNDRKHDVSVHVTTWGTRVHAQANAVGIGNFSVVRLLRYGAQRMEHVAVLHDVFSISGSDSSFTIHSSSVAPVSHFKGCNQIRESTRDDM